MTEKQLTNFNLGKSVLLGLIFPIIFLFFFLEKTNLNPILDKCRLLTGERIIASGIIIKAKYFEDFIESNEHTKTTEVSGYEYDYVFISKKGEKIITKNYSYGQLPNNKLISEIPYKVKVEYLAESPKNNRIVDLYYNESFVDFLKKELFIPLLIFLFCSYAAFKIIERGVNKYNFETKYSRK
ncbi:hypothetical protein GON26_18645 [Flavobacterium sp. GA093]|uniref:Uncharacterized protein n=1 Tax=Flavobacterium hydrocarbonoxydans TaxID=2683249 RepID=A0A6I4NZ97_9FLAO|nr:hypothetical protein [Flavobacterium hydrocarbonoxydans]MWB96387.1 hypothetical protein [Flavobacterium hydrocarbonoxydans]